MTREMARRPPGRVSEIRGRLQAPVLDWLTRGVLALSVAGGFLPGRPGRVFATIAVVLIVCTPLARVAWLVHRWRQEQDRVFVRVGLALLAVVACGGALALAGAGG